MSNEGAFARWFKQSTGNESYPFQIRVVCEPTLARIGGCADGEGKTSRNEHMIGLFGLVYWTRLVRAATKHTLSYDWLIGKEAGS